MGPLALEQPRSPYDVYNKQTRTVLCAFPSPASVTSSLDTPTLQYSSSGDRCNPEHLFAGNDLLEATNVLPTQPNEIMVEPVLTPPPNETPELNMDTIVGGALAPVHSNAPLCSPTRSRPGLRLPSFESLGIAAPHPDRYGGLNGTLTNAAREAMQEPLSVPHGFPTSIEALKVGATGPEVAPNPSIERPGGRALQSPVHHIIDTITPPPEVGCIKWNLTTATVTSAMDSPLTDPGNANTGAGDVPIAPDAAATALASQIPTSKDEADENPPWTEGAIKSVGQ